MRAPKAAVNCVSTAHKRMRIVIQFDEKFLSPAAHQLHRPHAKSKRPGQIYINFTQPSKIGFYLATIKKGEGPRRTTTGKKFFRYHFSARRFSSWVAFIIFLPVHPPPVRHHVTIIPEAMVEKTAGNIAMGAFPVHYMNERACKSPKERVSCWSEKWEKLTLDAQAMTFWRERERDADSLMHTKSVLLLVEDVTLGVNAPVNRGSCLKPSGKLHFSPNWKAARWENGSTSL